jgi:hypothetical protein
MNNELEKIWKEAVMAYCKVLSQHLLGGTEGKHKTLSGQPVSELRFESGTYGIQCTSNNLLMLFVSPGKVSQCKMAEKLVLPMSPSLLSLMKLSVFIRYILCYLPLGFSDKCSALSQLSSSYSRSSTYTDS